MHIRLRINIQRSAVKIIVCVSRIFTRWCETEGRYKEKEKQKKFQTSKEFFYIFVIQFQNHRDGHDSARETSRPRELADGRQGENGTERLPSKRGSSSALLPTRPATASTIARASPVFSLRSAGRFKRELQIPGPDPQDTRRGGQRYGYSDTDLFTLML